MKTRVLLIVLSVTAILTAAGLLVSCFLADSGLIAGSKKVAGTPGSGEAELENVVFEKRDFGKIKLAALHQGVARMPREANPYNDDFDINAAKEYIEENISRTCDLLREAGESGADLVITTEDCKGFDQYLRHLDKRNVTIKLLDSIPGPTTDRFGEIAEKYGMYICANFYERDGSKLYNTTVLIGRDGKVIGKYRKIHLPASEKWMIEAGDEIPVFETDIGRIGFVTCYDILFPEFCRAVALNGADIIVHPTMGWGMAGADIGEALVRTRAAENSVYFVVAKSIAYGDAGKSCIIDNLGYIVAEKTGRREGIAITGEVTPDYDIMDELHFDALFSGVGSVRARLVQERVPSAYSVITQPSSKLVESYAGLKLKTDEESIRNRYEEWMDYVKTGYSRYHW